MPYRRKATTKPRRKVMRRKRVAKASTNRKVDVHVKIKTIQSAVTGSSITGVGQYLYYAYGTVNSDYGTIQQLNEHKLHASMYDEYRVKRVSVKFIPAANAYQLLQSSTPGGNVGPQNDSSLYSFIDWDGRTPVSSSTAVPLKIEAYDSCKKGKIYRTMTRSFAPKSTYWLDSNTNYNSGNESLRSAGHMGVIGFYAEYLPVYVGGVVGSFEITYDVCYRGKKPTAFTRNNDGSITVGDLEAYPPLAPLNNVVDPEVNDVLLGDL